MDSLERSDEVFEDGENIPRLRHLRIIAGLSSPGLFKSLMLALLTTCCRSLLGSTKLSAHILVAGGRYRALGVLVMGCGGGVVALVVFDEEH